ncbi:Retrovirus-related Pol polyprotein from transposon 297 [Araneus ventricosus]|uniref:RNA-directed DNA polymerase n=1 Tax=Araneus ventricosus TaxID=182803 RepID=A0A4Y2EAU9_ARAVE|nr:Retrovirus-related Pol polyprotein from transposon 297 [Araneus ventricosus]GBM26712.1 Retrovirus-related Pol polyprotein from transposon 297 [Araneus ventricosus]
MPFGLCNAPATFERLMETVLRGLSSEACLVYLDDIIIVGRTFEEHLSNLRKVFQRLQNANLKLSPKKCRFFQKEVTYLGHVISAEGVKTDPGKIKAVVDWPRPETIHDLRSFLGLCTYYRRFVKNFSTIARPLHKLTETKSNFNWTEECEKSFNSLKQALTSSPILIYPRTDKDFILDTDASNEGIGAVLSQNIGNEERVIAYFSKSLGKPERNYCVTRKELLAFVKSIEHFHHYLYGQKFLLRSDHASLRWLLNFKEPEGQIARCIQRLQEYDFEIQHRKETSHGNADALSRILCGESCKHCSNAEKKFGIEIDTSVKVLTTTSVDPSCEIRKAQLEDDAIKTILEKKLMSADRPSWQEIAPESPATKRYWALWDSLHLKDGVLYRRWESDDGRSCRWQLILPKSRIALHPESDGMVERFNRTILNHLSLFVSRNQTDWDTHLPLFLLAYRSAEHEVTGLTPAEMLFGRTLRLPCDILFGRPSETPSSPNEYMKNLEARLESVHAFARERIKLASERMKTRYDSRATDHHFKEGDLVWMYNPKRRRGLSPKLQQNWEGPYTIVKKLNDVVYRVQRSPNAKPKVIHINRLAPYRATDHSSM